MYSLFHYFIYFSPPPTDSLNQTLQSLPLNHSFHLFALLQNCILFQCFFVVLRINLLMQIQLNLTTILLSLMRGVRNFFRLGWSSWRIVFVFVVFLVSANRLLRANFPFLFNLFAGNLRYNTTALYPHSPRKILAEAKFLRSTRSHIIVEICISLREINLLMFL